MSVRLLPSLARAARGLAGWSAEDLARESGVSASTIATFEAAQDTREPVPADATALLTAFERAGIEFIPEEGGGYAVRLRTDAAGQDLSAGTVPVEALNSSNDK